MDDLIDEFVRNKNGKATYRSWLNTFFESIGYLTKIEGKKGAYKTLREPNLYFRDNRNHGEDALKFADAIDSWAPGTRRGAILCFKNFLMLNNVRLKPKTEYMLREYQKGPTAISQEIVPSRQELKEILSYGDFSCPSAG